VQVALDHDQPRLTRTTAPHFVTVPGDATGKVQCKSCGRHLYAQGTTSTNLTRHIESCKRKRAERDAAPDAAGAAPSRRTSDAECTQKLKDLVVQCGLPLDIVAQPAFRDFVEAVGHNGGSWRIPSRRTLTRQIVSDAESLATDMKKRIASLHSYALTVDSWTSSSNISYVATGAHGIDSEWKRHSYVLNIRAVTEKHTAATIPATIKDMFTGLPAPVRVYDR
jgi:hypothetical protein